MYQIVKKKVLNPTVTMMDIAAPLVAKKAEAGQFIILRVNEDGERVRDTDRFTLFCGMGQPDERTEELTGYKTVAVAVEF